MKALKSGHIHTNCTDEIRWIETAALSAIVLLPIVRAISDTRMISKISKMTCKLKHYLV